MQLAVLGQVKAVGMFLLRFSFDLGLKLDYLVVLNMEHEELVYVKDLHLIQ